MISLYYIQFTPHENLLPSQRKISNKLCPDFLPIHPSNRPLFNSIDSFPRYPLTAAITYLVQLNLMNTRLWPLVKACNLFYSNKAFFSTSPPDKKHLRFFYFLSFHFPFIFQLNVSCVTLKGNSFLFRSNSIFTNPLIT